VLGVPLADIDKLTKLIPGLPGMSLVKTMSSVPDFVELYNSNPQMKQVIDLAMKLEGLCRNAGVHAAGVIIADQPLDTIIPLCKDKDDNVLTQFEGPISEKCGLLKMDFLGLRTLSTRSARLIWSSRPAQRAMKWSPNQPEVPLDEGPNTSEGAAMPRTSWPSSAAARRCIFRSVRRVWDCHEVQPDR
jgi:hypothetical protein